VAAELERLRAAGHPAAKLPLELVENTRFRDGNLLSLLAARPRIDGEFVLCNVDHIYRPAIAEVVRPESSEVTAFIDTDRTLGAGRHEGRARPGRAGAPDRQDADHLRLRLRGDDPGARGWRSERYFAMADRALGEEGPPSTSSGCWPAWPRRPRRPSAATSAGHGWLEVDTPGERAHAEEALRAPGWE
jgi:hypothetical protein